MLSDLLETTAGQVAAIAGILLGLGVIWRKGIRPVTTGIARLVDVIPVWFKMADQFESNGGSSMSDRLDAVHDGVAVAVALGEEAKTAASTAAAKVEKVARKLAGVSKVQAEHRKYVHENNRVILDRLATIEGAATVSARQHARKPGEERRSPKKAGAPARRRHT